MVIQTMQSLIVWNIYNVEHKKILKESLGLIGPISMEKMRKWRAQKKAVAGSLAAAIANTEIKEHIVPVKENTSKRKEINLDDALLD